MGKNKYIEALDRMLMTAPDSCKPDTHSFVMSQATKEHHGITEDSYKGFKLVFGNNALLDFDRIYLMNGHM